MIKEIARLERELSIVNVRITSSVGGGSDPRINKRDSILSEVIQRDRKEKMLQRFKNKIAFVHEITSCIEDDRESTILMCLMDGMNVIQIAEHMGFSKRAIHRIKNEIIKKIYRRIQK